MQRIVLIGPGGAGKSTLAKDIAERTGLPLIHLDGLYWKHGWQPMPDEQWQQQVAELVGANNWVMDGNFGGTLDVRLAACDTAILLDMPPLLCLMRVIGRHWRYRGRSRPDMAPGCPERIDLDFLWWILSYRWRRLPAVLKKLSAAAATGKQIHVLRSAAQVQQFVAGIRVKKDQARSST